MLCVVHQQINETDKDKPLKCWIDSSKTKILNTTMSGSKSYTRFYVYAFEGLAPMIREYCAIRASHALNYTKTLLNPNLQTQVFSEDNYQN